jgi:hypothetical protein
MEPNLELLIALGGIATGIGAIWTAIVTRSLARATERSLAEQTERGRLSLEVDLIYRFLDQWESRTFSFYRRRSLQYIKENYIVDDELLEVQHLDVATRRMFDYIDEIGYLTRSGVLRFERVWQTYKRHIVVPWALWEPAVKKLREEEGDPSLYAGFEYLYHQALDFERKRGGTGTPPTKEEVRHSIESSLQAEEETIAAVWKEEPASGDEGEPTR